MPDPLISVVLPVYNGEPYIAAALESILRQDYDRFEVIALDDGSTDRSLEVLQPVSKSRRSYPRRITGEPRTHCDVERGHRLDKATLSPEWTPDDISYPTRFSRQVALFKAASARDQWYWH